MKLRITGLLLFLLSVNLMFGQLTTERSFYSNSAQTLGKGDFQMESGLFIAKFDFPIYDDDRSNGSMFNFPQLQSRYGISDRLELRGFIDYRNVKINNYSVSTISGITDILLGLKYALTKDPSRATKIGVGADLVIPIDEELGYLNRGLGVNTYFALDHYFSNKSILRTNARLFYQHKGSESFNLMADYGYPLTSKLTFVAGLIGGYDFDFDQFYSNASTGFNYLLNSRTQIDMNFSASFTDKSYGGGIGLSHLFGK